ncbi:MAG TPA: glutamate synthase subunit beta [bacterium]|nr:glutamate synthase subunit beta [bacterium]
MIRSKAFLEIKRENPTKRPVAERLGDDCEFEQPLSPEQIKRQAARCMDCGIPFCHGHGCPLHNRIPEWNEMVFLDRWAEALDLLHDTNNFPEITGRICPAPCETACTVAINDPGVAICHIELQIVERGFREGWIVPEPASYRTGKHVAIVGSGPAGLAAAQQLARCGHEVTVFEKDDQIGGLLRYGIPDFKLDKGVLERRLKQMRAEGVIFETEVEVGIDLSTKFLQRSFDVIVLAHGARVPRDLAIPGRDADGVHFALEFLVGQNRRVAGLPALAAPISARNKNVVVIGGGDTGSDCIGFSNRQGAASVTQLEILPRPPAERLADNPWPTWPNILRTSSSQQEGCERLWAVTTNEILAADGRVSGLRCAKVAWETDPATGRRTFREQSGSTFTLPADLVLIAMGFMHCTHGPLIDALQLRLTANGSLAVDENMMTSAPGVFAAGDAVSGASLVVRAIDSGRRAAAGVDRYLQSK